MAIAAAAAITAAAAVSVVAIAFAIFAGLGPWIGSAGAAAVVAAVMALLVTVFALSVRGRIPGGRPRHRQSADEPDASMVQKMVEMAKERPLIATGIAVGAGIYAIRNPKLIAALAAAFMEGRSSAR